MSRKVSIFFLAVLFLLKTSVCAAQSASAVMPLFVENESNDAVVFTPSQTTPSKVLKLDRNTLSLFTNNNTNAIRVNYDGRDVVFFKKHANRIDTVSNYSGQDISGEINIVLTIGDDHLFGRIQGQNGEIIFEPGRQPYEVIQTQLDLSKEAEFIDDGVLVPKENIAGSALSERAAARVESADDGRRIDVMVLYTDGMAAAYPGTAIYTRIQYLIALANLAFSNSYSNTYLRLVHSKQVNYPDDSVGNLRQALDDLTENKGVFSGIERARDEYGADQVTLLRRFVDEGCGSAWIHTRALPSYAYAVTHNGFKTDGSNRYCTDLTYAHEIGHNLGAAHNRTDAKFPGIFDYSYGYQDPNGLFRTVMAYNCNGGCTRVAHFSNPKVDYRGNPTGIVSTQLNSAENALTINRTRVIMASYRAAIAIPAVDSLSGILNLLLFD